ncbi:MAG: carboxymuconolactone decarboxylase family protein [Bdellovibrionales bacterium]|nr:carboxymuconolactone decarboxylase family protein [Bdellovibrionales bacterium]
MSLRVNYPQISPDSYKHLLALEASLANSSIDKSLRQLIKIRVSQMNGCLFCLDMHVKEAKIHGERELRIVHLSAWHESSLFTQKEKVALEWAERLTKMPQTGVEDSEFQKAREYFSEKELADLTFVVGTINIWNRFGVAFRPTPGDMDKLMGLDKSGLV